MNWYEAQQKIDDLRAFVLRCAWNGVNCGVCRNALEEAQKIESKFGTAHPDNRAKSSGALAR